MNRIQTYFSSALLAFAVLAAAPTGASAQFFSGSSYKAEAAIISAGSRAAAISRLKRVPSVGVVNLNVRSVPLFRSDAPDVAEFRISASKNANGIRRLRTALAANPATRHALANHGIAIGRVVGVDIYSNGSIRVYII
jgi:predicted solute-binding protein